MDASLILLNGVLTALQGVMMALFVLKSISLRRPYLYLFLSTAGLTVLYLVKLYLPIFPPAWDSAFSMLLWIVFPLLFSKEKRSTTLLTTILYTAALTAADLMTAVLTAQIYHRNAFELLAQPSSLLTMKLTFLFHAAIFSAPVYWAFNRKLHRQAQKTNLFPFAAVPLMQAVTLGQFLLILQRGALGADTYFLFALLAIGSLVACIAFFRALSKLQQEQLLKEQASLAEQQLAIQLHYYHRLEDNITAINRIRHDIRNQLQTAYLLMDSGETVQARQQLDQICSLTETKVGTVFTENLIVDAVLIEKSWCCEEAGICLQANIALPRQIAIEGIHLCSAFANILDNAIVACRTMAASRIELESFIQSGLLVLRCQNTVGEKTTRKKAGSSNELPVHGLGLGILEMIAKQYHGNLKMDTVQDQFQLVLTLNLPTSTLECDS